MKFKMKYYFKAFYKKNRNLKIRKNLWFRRAFGMLFTKGTTFRMLEASMAK